MDRFINQIIQGDCLEVMPSIPDKSIDMILCDLPYGTTACKWDTIIPFEPLWDNYKRIIKDNGAIALTASQPFTSALVMSNPKMFRHEWIWKKSCGSNFATLKHNPFKEHESIIVFSKKPVKYYPIFQKREGDNKRYLYAYNSIGGGDCIGGKLNTDKGNRQELRHPSSVQKFNRETGFHPTQKPVALFEYLIKTYTNEGEVVLDNCLGSGTTAVACLNIGRKFIGIEQDEHYCEIARERIAKADKTGMLFAV